MCSRTSCWFKFFWRDSTEVNPDNKNARAKYLVQRRQVYNKTDTRASYVGAEEEVVTQIYMHSTTWNKKLLVSWIVGDSDTRENTEASTEKRDKAESYSFCVLHSCVKW